MKTTEFKRCLGCGYILDGLPEPRCPECGRVFDPQDPVTYARGCRSGRGVAWAIIVTWVLAVGFSALIGPLGIGMALAATIGYGAFVVESLANLRKPWCEGPRRREWLVVLVVATIALATCLLASLAAAVISPIWDAGPSEFAGL